MEKERVAKAKRSPTIQTRMWSATCARKRDTARVSAGTPRRMAALANLHTKTAKEPKAGAKGTKGKKGGGKGKGKAHSFEGEGEDEQEWPEGDGQDGEQAGDGDLDFLCVLGPSPDSAPGPPPAASGQICRPAFGPVSWAWSQPWKVALAECQVLSWLQGTKEEVQRERPHAAPVVQTRRARPPEYGPVRGLGRQEGQLCETGNAQRGWAVGTHSWGRTYVGLPS